MRAIKSSLLYFCLCLLCGIFSLLILSQTTLECFLILRFQNQGLFQFPTHCWSNLILTSSSLSYTLTSYQSVLMFWWFPLYFIIVPEVSLCKMETKWINWVCIMSSIVTWRVNESIEINIGIDVMNFSSWTGNWSQN